MNPLLLLAAALPCGSAAAAQGPPSSQARAVLLSPQRAAADPLERELERLEAKGYLPAAKASAKLPGGRLVALALRQGARVDLRVYRVDERRAKLLFLEPGYGKTVSLAAPHERGAIPDLAGDGSRVVAYQVAFPGAGQESLVLLRYAGGALARAAELPQGAFEDLDGDGKAELVSRERPLGRWFQVQCEDFFSGADGALRTRVHAWRKGALVDASAGYGAYFAESIRRKEQALKGRSPWGTDDYGGFLGDALSLYFDYAAAGRQREGWTRFLELFPVPGAAPGKVKECARSLRSELAGKLGIPPEW